MKLKVIKVFFGSGATKCMGKYWSLVVATRTRMILKNLEIMEKRVPKRYIYLAVYIFYFLGFAVVLVGC